MEIRKVREITGHTSAVYSLCAGGAPGRILSCGSEGVVAEWDVESGEGRAMATAPAAVFSMCLVANRKLLLLGLQNGEVVFVDLGTGRALKRVALHRKAVFDLLPLPDGENVLASSEDGAISVWNLERLDHIHYQQVAPKSIRTLALDGERGLLYLGASDMHIREMDLGLNLLRDWKGHAQSVFRLLVGAGGRLYSTGRDAHIRLWDLHAGLVPTEVLAVPAHNYAVNDLCTGPGGLLVSGSMDKSFKVWNPETLELLKVVNWEKNGCHWNGINRLLWHEERLLTCGDDRKIMVWELGIER